MLTLMLFGGPSHGKTERVRHDASRFQVAMRSDPGLSLRAPGMLLSPHECTFQALTYYVHEYHMQNTTEEGARVCKSQFVGLFEGAPLFREEEHDLEDHIRDSVPWQWLYGKPNFLKQFDQWYEYTLCEVMGHEPKVRYL